MMTIFLIGAAIAAADPVPAPATPAPTPTPTPTPAPEGGVLTLDEAVRRALTNHPTRAEAEAHVSEAEARVQQTYASKRPQLDGNATAGVSGTEPPDFLGPNPTARVSLSLGWLLTDFGTSEARTRAAQVGVDVAKTGITGVEYQLVVAVESSYFEVVARDQLIEVVQAAVDAETRHLSEAERLVKVGIAPSFDAAQARTRLALARTQLARAKGDARAARARLAQAIGGGDTASVIVTTTWPGPESGEDGSLDALVAEAISKRPDAALAELSLRAADASIDVAQQGLNPTLGLGAEIGAQVTEDVVGAGWSATVALKWPFLDGGLTSAQIDEARAGRTVADAEKATLLLQIRSDVESSQVAIQSAKSQLEAATASRDIAKESLRLAEARYAQGLSSGIELADAQASVIATGADTVSAEWTLASARAALRAALGRGVRGAP